MRQISIPPLLPRFILACVAARWRHHTNVHQHSPLQQLHALSHACMVFKKDRKRHRFPRGAAAFKLHVSHSLPQSPTVSYFCTICSVFSNRASNLLLTRSCAVAHNPWGLPPLCTLQAISSNGVILRTTPAVILSVVELLCVASLRHTQQSNYQPFQTAPTRAPKRSITTKRVHESK